MKTAHRFASRILSSTLLFTSVAAFADDAATSIPATAAAPALAVASGPASTVPKWQVLPEKSSIEWAATYSGKAVSGSFKEFTSDIAFSPDRLDASLVTVSINTSRISSEDKDAEQALPGADWFDSAKLPHAVFEAKTFRHVADEKYEADGTLTLGDKHVPVTLPFSVHFYDDNETVPPARYAQVSAETTLKRTALGVGKGDWAATDTVSDDVKVTINLKAKSSLQPASQPTSAAP